MGVQEGQWKWGDIKPYMGLVRKTHTVFSLKFYPLYRGREKDLEMDLIVILLGCLPKLKAGKVNNVKSYLITAWKIQIYKQAAKLIEQKQTELYLEEMGISDDENLSWEDIIAGTIIDVNDVFSRFTEEELPIALHLTGNGPGRDALMKEERIGRYKYERLKRVVLEKMSNIIELKRAGG